MTFLVLSADGVVQSEHDTLIAAWFAAERLEGGFIRPCYQPF